MKNKLATPEIILIFWAGLAFVLLIPIALFFRGTIPIFTMIWLFVPLIVVITTWNAKRIGFRRIPWKIFILTTLVNLGLLGLISLAIEPWSHTYQALVTTALASSTPDTTFAWLIRYKGIIAWLGLLLYSGLVTKFAEELFFRGWILQSLQTRTNKVWAIVFQASLFTIPQVLAAFLLLPVQGVVYAVVYSFIGVGLIGGWAAARTQSIWPSLAAATIWNIILTAIVM